MAALTIKKGDTFKLVADFSPSTDNLTGVTISGKIGDQHTWTDLSLDQHLKVDLSISATLTSAMDLGSYEYELTLTYPNGDVRTVVEGLIGIEE